MSIVPEDSKIVSKLISLPELCFLQFVKTNYRANPQLSAIRDLIKEKDPKLYENGYAMNRYYAQVLKTFQFRENFL